MLLFLFFPEKWSGIINAVFNTKLIKKFLKVHQYAEKFCTVQKIFNFELSIPERGRKKICCVKCKFLILIVNHWKVLFV